MSERTPDRGTAAAWSNTTGRAQPPVPDQTVQGPDRSEWFIRPPAVNLPKGGGAIRSIGEKFASNPVTGTGSMTVPIEVSPGRSGFQPELALSYDSGSGNGPFGWGWNFGLPMISRKTDKGLPRYRESDRDEEPDIFILSGAEDLVPVLELVGDAWQMPAPLWLSADAAGRWVEVIDPADAQFAVTRYRPRTEGLFARIERWTAVQSGEIHWRTIAKDNVYSIYGASSGARVADAQRPGRVFSWLIEASFDDRGNAIRYDYATEDGRSVGLGDVSEAHRAAELAPGRQGSQRYVKRICYGNRAPVWRHEAITDRQDWLFQVVFDYGDHSFTADGDESGSLSGPQPSATPDRDWPVRNDPFSTYRATFEVRTYRLCRRVLQFHHFVELGTEPCLVRSLDLHHRVTPRGSFVTAVTRRGYVRDGDVWRFQAMPPIEFEYTEARISGTVQVLEESSLEHLPAGVDGSAYQWLDVYGEGLAGVITEAAEGWYFKRSLGDGRFEPIALLRERPGLGNLGAAGQQFLDLAGDGSQDLVLLGGGVQGYFESNGEGEWDDFRPFRHVPNVAWNDPNLRTIDLTGDGHADVLVTLDDRLLWYPSLAEEGFDAPEWSCKPHEEHIGPALVFANGEQSIYLADMTGDGLSDIVRVRNGSICYWPSLGYGRFGPMVTMRDAPTVDWTDRFDQRRVRLADIDGTGATDLIYLDAHGVSVWFNESGNGWTAREQLPAFPGIDNIVSVNATDLLGNGTACLVLSSPLPSDAGRPLRFVDLMGGVKPHLLRRVVNNLGAETLISYTSSTKAYVEDRLAGRPWVTKLPFPVQVVERVEVFDHVSRNRFSSRYGYHHGCFDGEEREFRGFGYVEQVDTEAIGVLEVVDPTRTEAANWDEASYVPPVLTKTWYHTGAYLEADTLEAYFKRRESVAGDDDDGPLGRDRDRYYNGDVDPDSGEVLALRLPDTLYPSGIAVADPAAADGLRIVPRRLSLREEREAARALRGSVLRQEVFALDGDPERGAHPYTVSERSHVVTWLQPSVRRWDHHDRDVGPPAVFFVHPVEQLDCHYERRSDDPRIAHQMTLAVDLYGNVLRAASIGYGRRRPDLDPDDIMVEGDHHRQGRTLITYVVHRHTNAIDRPADIDGYRTPVPADVRTVELTGTALADSKALTPAEVAAALAAATEIPYRAAPYELDQISAALEWRLIEAVRTQYRPDDLGAAAGSPLALLPVGTVELLALPGETYRLALTPDVLSDRFGARVTDDMLREGGYVQLDGGASWWVPSGRTRYVPSDVGPDDELAEARAHFFQPRLFRDPFGNGNRVDYDWQDLLPVETVDPLGNSLSVENDYRVLHPAMATDPNLNRAAARFDALGMVVATAVMGKETETDPAAMGDTLDDPTTRLEYDLFAWRRSGTPATVHTFSREQHGAGNPRWQEMYSYSDGFGREIQKKVQAEPGPITDGGPVVGARWVGSGWTIFNNKGKPVREYEPFFSAAPAFEFGRMVGVSSTLFYDPAERVIATLHPNHSWEKVVFDPWRQTTWDVNDTVVLDPETDADVADLFRRLESADFQPTWFDQRIGGFLGPAEQDAARKTMAHAATPTTAWFDVLGRPFLTVQHNGPDAAGQPDLLPTRVLLDVEGNQRSVRDALITARANGREVMRYRHDMLGQVIYQHSMDAGERWMLNDVLGAPLYAWDGLGHAREHKSDALRRLTHLWVSGGSVGARLLAERTVFGERHPNALALNLRGQPFMLLDGAGVVTNAAYDFKGNILGSTRRLARKYQARSEVVWSGVEAVLSPPPALPPAVPPAPPPPPPATDPPLDLAVIEQALAQVVEREAFTARTSYDALNRPVAMTSPDGSVVRPTYNEANLLERIEANLRGAATPTVFVDDIDYDAKGQRASITYGDGVATSYTYDPLTYRLTHMETLRGRTPLQDFSYTYDPHGNITSIRDRAQQTVYFRNQVVTPGTAYVYDPIYRLIEATGREHIGQTTPAPTSPSDVPRVNLPHPNDGQGMRRYTELYAYDAVGNIKQMRHVAVQGSWTRDYTYAESSPLEGTVVSNRLSQTAVGAQVDAYVHDENGNMTSMNEVGMLHWDFEDQVDSIDLSTGGMAYYAYDTTGQRVRKVIHQGFRGLRDKERIYIGGWEVYRTYSGIVTRTVDLERESLSIMDDKRRIALVDTKTREGGQPVSGGAASLLRYQLGDHLDSVGIEVDGVGEVISYEEHYPYGCTSYQGRDQAMDGDAKRYRYTGKERDEESGLSYHEVRYYSSWLGRWTRCDPLALVDGPVPYAYVKCNPMSNSDLSGENSDPVSQCSVDPTEPTTRESALQQSLPVGERYEPVGPVADSRVDVKSIPETEESRIRDLQQSVEYVRDRDVSSERNRLIDLYEGVVTIAPEDYVGSVYADVLPPSATEANYSAAARNTAHESVSNRTRWSLQSSLVQYGITYGKEELSKRAETSTEFSYQIHKEAFRFANDTNTIGRFPWALLTRVDVPKILGNERGGKVINWTIETTNSPHGFESLPWYGKALRVILEVPSIATPLYD